MRFRDIKDFGKFIEIFSNGHPSRRRSPFHSGSRIPSARESRPFAVQQERHAT